MALAPGCVRVSIALFSLLCIFAMSVLDDSTTPQSCGAGSPRKLVEQAKFVDPVTGTDVHPEVMEAILQYVLSLPPDMDDHSSSAPQSTAAPNDPSQISQNPYSAWTAWTRQGWFPQAPSAASSTFSNRTGTNSYEAFWSKFNNGQYLEQLAANESAKTQLRTGVPPANGLAPAGSRFPFTNTVAPDEIFGSIRRKTAAPSRDPDVQLVSCTSGCMKPSPLKRELTQVYTKEDLLREFPSHAHLIKVIPGKLEASFICNRFGCGTEVSGDPAAILRHGQSHHLTGISTITCIFGRCFAKVDPKDFRQHVGAHLQSNGARCGVCGDWFASTKLATEHITQPCPMLLFQSRAEGHPPPHKKIRRTASED